MVDEMGEWQTLAMAQQDSVQKKLADIFSQPNSLSRANDGSMLFASPKQPPLSHRPEHMLNGALKR